MIRSVTERDVTNMEWRQCVGFPAYEVSECGDVRRIQNSRTRKNGWRLRGFIDVDGYLRYALLDAAGSKRLISAHRLVADAFLGPAPSPDHEIAHNNGSRVSCYFRDLRWATRLQNDSDRQIHGTSPKGERNPRAKITEADVHFIRSEYRAIKHSQGARSVTELEAKFGLHRATIIQIAKGQSWSHIPMENVA
ncbi:MAG: NUMOD4 domain-containing protein [Pseudomonadota bacterium]